MRMAGVIICAAAVLAAGFYAGFSIRRRIINLHRMENAAALLKGEIAFSGRILEEAFFDMSRRLAEPFGKFFASAASYLQEENSLEDAWKQAEADLKNNSLTEEDLDLFRTLGRELGFLDVEMQLRTLELVEGQLIRRIKELEEQAVSGCRMYQSLGILGAVAVMIIFW